MWQLLNLTFFRESHAVLSIQAQSSKTQTFLILLHMLTEIGSRAKFYEKKKRPKISSEF